MVMAQQPQTSPEKIVYFLWKVEHIYQNVSMLASSAMQSKLDGFNNQRILTLFDELQAVSDKTIKDRLASAYPKADELIVLVSSPDKNALADACVITQPQQAKDC